MTDGIERVIETHGAARGTSSRSARRAAWSSARNRSATTATTSRSTRSWARRTGSCSTTAGVFLPPWGKVGAVAALGAAHRRGRGPLRGQRRAARVAARAGGRSLTGSGVDGRSAADGDAGRPSACVAKSIAIVKRARGSTSGSSSATWIDSPSSSADQATANARASTSSTSPAAMPSSTMRTSTRASGCRARGGPWTPGGAGTPVPTGRTTSPTTSCRPPVGHERHLHDPLEALLHAGRLVEHPVGHVVERRLGPAQRLGEQLVLGAEVVDDQRRRRAGPSCDVGDAGLGEAALGDEGGRGLEHLVAPLVRRRGDLASRQRASSGRRC